MLYHIRFAAGRLVCWSKGVAPSSEPLHTRTKLSNAVQDGTACPGLASQAGLFAFVSILTKSYRTLGCIAVGSGHGQPELLPDVVIIDLRMTATFAVDETAKEQAERLGAVKFIDKMELANELVPTLLQFAPPNKPS